MKLKDKILLGIFIIMALGYLAIGINNHLNPRVGSGDLMDTIAKRDAEILSLEILVDSTTAEIIKRDSTVLILREQRISLEDSLVKHVRSINQLTPVERSALRDEIHKVLSK